MITIEERRKSLLQKRENKKYKLSLAETEAREKLQTVANLKSEIAGIDEEIEEATDINQIRGFLREFGDDCPLYFHYLIAKQ
jgi:hypothetical protein